MTDISNEPSGILIVNKEKGPTSHDIVNRIRRALGIKRVGHTGTLDPLATGVLVVLVGRAAKAAEYLVSDRKKYRASMRLGITTDTEDVTGTVLSEYAGRTPSEEDVRNTCLGFIGKGEQTPPMYSALKVGGKKLVDIARKGETVERLARPVEIFSLDFLGKDKTGDYVFETEVSSGTYIRTLCNDIGKKLGCGAVMSELCRLETGGFDISESTRSEKLAEMTKEEIISHLIPTEELFQTFHSVRLPTFYEKLLRSGCEIYQKKIKTDFDIGEKVRILSENGDFFALGEVKEYESGTAIKSVKIFVL